MPIVSDTYTHVIGVDTHARHHSYAILEATTARLLTTAEFPTHHAGLARAINWIARHTDGNITDTLISIEGTGSYGARLSNALLNAGYRVVDAPSPKRARGESKNDTIDARKAAQAMLARDSLDLADARTGEVHQQLKVVLAARDRRAKEKTRAMNALTALLREHDLGFDARTKPTMAAIKTIARWRTRTEAGALAYAREEAVVLAKRVVDLQEQLKANERVLQQIVLSVAPVLLAMPGVGPFSAAVVLCVWSHHGRVKSEAGLARMAGVAPIQIQSGRNDRYRLDRGGDRQLNRALHTIASSRMLYDERTKGYVGERDVPRKAMLRTLKRYIVRDMFRTLNRLELAA